MADLTEGQLVQFQTHGVKGTGRIRGLALRHIVDWWIIEIVTVEGMDRETYPWSCITSPCTPIVGDG